MATKGIDAKITLDMQEVDPERCVTLEADEASDIIEEFAGGDFDAFASAFDQAYGEENSERRFIVVYIMPRDE